MQKLDYKYIEKGRQARAKERFAAIWPFAALGAIVMSCFFAGVLPRESAFSDGTDGWGLCAFGRGPLVRAYSLKPCVFFSVDTEPLRSLAQVR